MRAELNRYELGSLTVRQHDDLALLEDRLVDSRLLLFNGLDYLADLIYGTDRLCGCFAHREESPGRVHIQAGDSLCSFDSRDESLRSVHCRINHYVVAAWVHHRSVVDEEDRILYVRLHAAHEAWVAGDAGTSAQTWLRELGLHEE